MLTNDGHGRYEGTLGGYGVNITCLKGRWMGWISIKQGNKHAYTRGTFDATSLEDAKTFAREWIEAHPLDGAAIGDAD